MRVLSRNDVREAVDLQMSKRCEINALMVVLYACQIADQR
jgi:hypothetical protein